MKKATFITCSLVSFSLLLTVWEQSALAQTNRIPPVQIDDWFNKRLVWVIILGALLGWGFTIFWLPHLSPLPHRDDNKRARKHFLYGCLLAAILFFLVLSIDASLIYQFGNRSYTFINIVSDVLFTLRSLMLISLGLVVFLIFVAGLTRFSKKSYRYMLIRK